MIVETVAIILELTLLASRAKGNLVNETKLRKDLLDGYDNRIRPENTENPSLGTVIHTLLLPFYLEDIKETEGVAIIYFDIDLKWTDNRLRWNSTNEQNVPICIFFEMRQIWTPYLRFKNTLSQREEKSGEYPIRVCENGLVHLFYTTRVKSSSDFNIRKFPYDSQDVDIHFSHPSAGTQEIDLNYTHLVDDGRMETIIEWEYQNFSCFRSEQASLDTSYKQIHAFITCTLEVKRNPRYYIVNFLVPSSAVTFLAILGTHSAATLSGPRTTKYQLGLMAMMATSVLTLSIVEMLPRSEQISRLHLFYFGLIGTIVSSTCCSWVTMTWERHRRKSRAKSQHSLQNGRANECQNCLIDNASQSRLSLKKSSIAWSSNLIDLVSAFIHFAFLVCLVIWFCTDI